MPHVSRLTPGESSIKVFVVGLRLSCTRLLCVVIMADSTTGYGVINRMPPVIVGCVRGIFSPNFRSESLSFSFQPASQMNSHFSEGTSCTLSSLLALLPPVSCFRHWCDVAGWQWPWQGWGRTSLVPFSLEMSRGVGGEIAGGVSLYCAPLCPIQLCGDLAGLLCPVGRTREGEVEGHDPCGARVGRRC